MYVRRRICRDDVLTSSRRGVVRRVVFDIGLQTMGLKARLEDCDR